jgi:hypothetical protein
MATLAITNRAHQTPPASTIGADGDPFGAVAGTGKRDE